MAAQVKKEYSTNTSSGSPSVGALLEVKKEAGVYASTSSHGGSTVKTELASKIKQTLVQAWGERWTEIQWSIQLKRLVAAYPSDSVDIAELLMQQALVGSSPNSLFLSYLKHSVLSQAISFHSAVKHISAFDDFSRPYCVLAVLHMAEMFGSKMSLSPCQDCGLQLVRTVLRLLHWLVKVMANSMQRVQDGRFREYFVILDNSSRAISNILERKTICSLLQIARADNAESYREFEQSEMNARSTLSQVPNIKEETKEKINAALAYLSKLEESTSNAGPMLQVIHAPISPSITGLVALEAFFNPGSDLQSFVKQVLLVSRLMKLTMPQLCLEMFRACFMGYLDTYEFTEDLQLATFTFLKMPQILLAMKHEMPDWDMAQHVMAGLDMVLEFSHLLDQIDLRHNYDMLTQFVNELRKADILTEAQAQTVSQKRAEQRCYLSDVTGSNESKNLSRVTHAEHTVTSILKSLDSDPVKTSESMVKVLSIMHQGHSFDILRLAASATGRLGDFITKLIRMNEVACSTTGDPARIPNKNQLFDITFLMVISLFQQNGIESASGTRENETSLVVQWAQRWLPKDGQYRNAEVSAGEDQDKVDCLLNMMLTGQDISPCRPLANWKELIMFLPCAMQEILFALEHKSLSLEKVKSIVEFLRKQPVKSLLVICVTYLCSYISMVSASARQKPMDVLTLFISSFETPKMYGTSAHSAETKQPVHLIIDHITFDLLPEGHDLRPKRRYALANHSKRLSSDTMSETLTGAFRRGWLNIQTLHTLEQLLALRGPDWFCGQMVDHLLQQSHIDDTSQSLSLALAILHLDLERLTVSLLARCLPRLLASAHTNALTDPRGYCLAKLCVLAVTAAHTAKTMGQREPYVRRLHKRSAQEAELDEEVEDSETPTKLRKLSEPQLTFALEEFNLDAIADKEDGDTSLSFDVKDPLNKALVNVFALMSSVLQTHSLTPRTWFIVSFVQEAVRCGGPHTRFILQFMPQNMLSQLMRSLPGVFSDEQLLKICDLYSLSGRKMAAKAVCSNNNIPPLELFD